MMDEKLERFCQKLQACAPKLKVYIDSPKDPDGEIFLDIASTNFSTSVSYHPKVGFGFSISEGAYGSRPEELYRNPEKSAVRVRQLLEQTAMGDEPHGLTLPEMRALIGVTQSQIASRLDIKQPSVQRFEKRQNLRLDTLAGYVGAMGGRLEVNVVFDDMEVRMNLNSPKEEG